MRRLAREHAYHRAANATARRRRTVHSHICERGGQIRGETPEKPITRVYISHYHPDHLLGAAAFSAPLYALAEVIAKIDAVGDRVASEEHEKHPDAIPAHAEKPSQTVNPGLVAIDLRRNDPVCFFRQRSAGQIIQR